MNIYILFKDFGLYGGRFLVGVFSSREEVSKAYKGLKKNESLISQVREAKELYIVEVMKLDDFTAFPVVQGVCTHH